MINPLIHQSLPWIDITEKAPPEKVAVLVFGREKENLSRNKPSKWYHITLFEGDYSPTPEFRALITHWMYLEPPKIKNE